MSITTTIEYSNNTFATVKEFTITTIGTGFTVSEGGVTDHGALTGLGDDDHTQYLNNARGDARYPTLTDYAADLLALNLELDGKFDTPTGDTTQYIAGDGSLIAFPVAGQAGTLVRQIRNETGATLTKGTVVYISGASGNKALVSKALATSDATSAQTFGVVQADISTNQNGYVVVRGDLIGLDTSAYVDGTQLYLSGSVAGTVTSTKPVAPIHMVYVGVVTRQHVNQGQIEVAIQNGYELDELHDVLIVSKTNKDVVSYESASGLWKNIQLTSSYISDFNSAAAARARAVVPLGFQSYAIGAAIGASAPRIDVNLDAPIVVEPASFVHVILKMPLGTATASQIIRGVVGINGYFE